MLSVALAIAEEGDNVKATTVHRNRFLQCDDLFRNDLLDWLGGGIVYVSNDGSDASDDTVYELARNVVFEEMHEQVVEEDQLLLHSIYAANKVADSVLLEEVVEDMMDGDDGTVHVRSLSQWVSKIVEDEGEVVDFEQFRSMFPRVPIIVVVD